jgi:hypothetical protein
MLSVRDVMKRAANAGELIAFTGSATVQLKPARGTVGTEETEFEPNRGDRAADQTMELEGMRVTIVRMDRIEERATQTTTDRSAGDPLPGWIQKRPPSGRVHAKDDIVDGIHDGAVRRQGDLDGCKRHRQGPAVTLGRPADSGGQTGHGLLLVSLKMMRQQASLSSF